MTAFNKRKLFVVIIVIVLITIVVFGVIIIMFLKGSMADDEYYRCRKVSFFSCNSATILVYDSTPKESIKGMKNFIKDNGYNGSEFSFLFVPDIQPPFDSSTYDYDLYWVLMTYKNVRVGHMYVNEKGEIIDSDDIITAEELFEIQMEPDIGEMEVYDIARKYLDTDQYIPGVGRVFRIDPDSGKSVFCYSVAIKCIESDIYDDCDYIYINGITGERVE